MVIDSLNLKLRQIVRFSSNVILDEMLSVKMLNPFWIFFDCSTRRMYIRKLLVYFFNFSENMKSIELISSD